MVPPPFPHKQYERFVRNRASRCGGLRTDHRHFQVWRKLEATDLDAVYATLGALYSADQGRIARHPVSMFRSCLAMMLCDVTSFDVWVPMMRDDPFYALISGFRPERCAGGGHLLRFPRSSATTSAPVRVAANGGPYRRRDQRDKNKQHKDKNDLRPHQDIVKRLADRILARPCQPTPLAAVLEGYGDFSALPPWEQVLQSLFYACFVTRSVDLKLIDLDELHTAGDGSKLPTWASPRGKKLCDCDNRGNKPENRCRCHRAYYDPLSSLGVGQLS